ncbi:Signal peptidase complex catalytic subunit SEC11 [Astathelohania contejeani]|uniref:Signal peptidase complex catalytic subunit SEC11 n=1 Tax=Astathelohania contejeani TaxID=164912 RepID=A0ABQ7HZR3_9MICR|nr:Signal peptidase complex catalytic subunit SEC11 [Thelohania contejeani]
MLSLFFTSSEIQAFKRMSKRQLLIQITNASYAIIGTYMLWKLISLFLNNDSPIVVVLSESMSPGFERGDILILKPKNYTTGDMCVFQLYKGEIPIVHRAIKMFGNRVLTKGDNNQYDDVSLYRKHQLYLTERDIRSCVLATLPYFGMITLWISSVPYLKVVLMSLVGVGVFFSRES